MMPPLKPIPQETIDGLRAAIKAHKDAGGDPYGIAGALAGVTARVLWKIHKEVDPNIMDLYNDWLKDAINFIAREQTGERANDQGTNPAMVGKTDPDAGDHLRNANKPLSRSGRLHSTKYIIGRPADDLQSEREALLGDEPVQSKSHRGRRNGRAKDRKGRASPSIRPK